MLLQSIIVLSSLRTKASDYLRCRHKEEECMEVFGYVRVSSSDQNEDRQLIAMSELGVSQERVFIDKMSGKTFERPAYDSRRDV